MSRSSNLLDLLLSSRAYRASERAYEERGVAEQEPFPFLAIVGQREMKLALVLALVNPNIGGVLLVGSRGTAKTTAVRGLVDLLPSVTTSLCPSGQGCTEALIEAGGMDAVCLECATRFGHGEPLSETRRVRIVELPLNARLDDVVGGIDERAALERRQVRLEQGLLAQADGNILYIDEVNLLDSVIADAILDAAAQGHYTVWRGPLKLTYQARFVLIGSMNPEEGRLRPQIMDRFGLRVLVRGLSEAEERYEVYRRTTAYRTDPEGMAAGYAAATLDLAEEIERARALLGEVVIGDEARTVGLALIDKMAIDSSRAEMTLFETARAHAAADGRAVVTIEDIESVALLALRLRQSPGLTAFFQTQDAEDAELWELLAETRRENG
jgi:magnesium chelatase subunit I